MRHASFSKFAPARSASLALVVAFAASVSAAEPDDLAQLRDQVNALEQKILVLERKQQIKDEAAATTTRTAPKLSVTDQGFALASGDGADVFKLRGLAQLDTRLYFDDHGAATDTFLLRRARIIAEGNFDKIYSFQLVPEFGGGSGTAASAFSILDANLGVTVSPELQFKLGKLKSPVGLELLQSDSWTFFDERSLVTNLVPNRDVGILANGRLFGGVLTYSAGVLNGVADGATSTNADFDSDKDFVARIFASPFKREAGSPWHGLSFGAAASLGREKSASGLTGGDKTDGQQTFFKYAPTTVADGRSWRLSPQLDYRRGPFGLLGEYVLSTVTVRPGATGPKAKLRNTAWEAAAGYVLTGEESSPDGVKPRLNFDWANGTWGAFELVARYAGLQVDDAAFPLYASASTNADAASSWGVGLNWYLSKTVAIKMDYYQTHFGFAPRAPAVSATPGLRQDEKALITRFQVSF